MKPNLKVLAGLFALFVATQAHATRWYSPSTGRWFSRDPIGDIAFWYAADEQALGEVVGNTAIDLALLEATPYGFIHNNTVNEFDYFGLMGPGRPPNRPHPVRQVGNVPSKTMVKSSNGISSTKAGSG